MISAALEDLDLAAVMAALREQEAAGHTAETDAQTDIGCFRDQLIRRAKDLDLILPGDRRNLPVGYQRAARIGALALATMRRIRFEQQREGGR